MPFRELGKFVLEEERDVVVNQGGSTSCKTKTEVEFTSMERRNPVLTRGSGLPVMRSRHKSYDSRSAYSSGRISPVVVPSVKVSQF